MDNKLYKFIHSLYLKYSTSLYQRAYHLLCNKERAEELVQETFYIASKKAQQLYFHTNPIGWLQVTLSNIIYKELRKSPVSEYPCGDDIASFSANIDDANLEHILPVGLSNDEKNVLILYYQYGYLYKEIADYLRISLSACSMRIQRAKKHCRDLLKI